MEMWRIHRSIGMDGSTLVRSFSDDAPERNAKTAERLAFSVLCGDGAVVASASGRAHAAAACGGAWPQGGFARRQAPEDELALLRKVLDSDDLVAEVTSAADVDTAKPEPDIIHVALQRAGVSADRAVFVGDAIWDAEACERAHVTSIGVLSGGVSRGELENAGAVMVFENADDLVKHIDETPIARLASIGSC